MYRAKAKHILLFGFVWIGASLFVLAAFVEVRGGELDRMRELYAEGTILSLGDLSAKARRIHPGTLVDARVRFEAQHDAYVYEVYILDARGLIWEVEFDAMTGELIERERKGP